MSWYNPVSWFGGSGSGRTKALPYRDRPSGLRSFIQQLGQMLGSATFTPSGFMRHYKEGYTKNGLVFAAINYYKKTIGQSTMVVKDEGGEFVDHELNEVFESPNPLMNKRNFLDALIDHYWLAGNVYLGRVDNKVGRPMELWPLMPHMMEIALDPNEWISHYNYKIGGTNQPLPKEQVVHIRYQDPTDFSVGFSPLQAAFRNVDVDNEMREHVKSIFENYAIPGIVIKLAQRELFEDEEKRERLEKRFQDKFGGKSKGKPAFIGADDDLEKVGLSMEELAFPDLSGVEESRILSVLGTSPILLDTLAGLDRSVFKNKKEARISFWQEDAFDLQDRIAEDMTDQLLKPLEGENTDLKVGWDNSEVPAVQEIKRREKKDARAEWKAGLTTRNEYRVQFDMEPLEDGRGDELNTSSTREGESAMEEEPDEEENESADEEAEAVGFRQNRDNGNL